jgi:uncharacterized protein YrrD
MDKYSEVIGLPVICVENGELVGHIKEVIFCPKEKRVSAYLLERKGLQVMRKLILSKDVLSLGKDAMIVNDLGCAREFRKIKETDDIKKSGKVRGLRVYTKKGDDLGIVEDILFDHKTGQIEGIEISDGLIQDIFKGRNVLPLFGKVEFGEENILVDKEAIEEMLETGGGIKNKLLGG